MRVYQTAQTLWQSAGSWKGVAKVLFFTELQNGIRHCVWAFSGLVHRFPPRVEDESSH